MPPTVWCTSFVVCHKNVIAFFAIISLPSVIALVREVLKTATVDAVVLISTTLAKVIFSQ